MRVGIFIDGLTLFYGLNGTRLDFTEFKKWLIEDDEFTYGGYFNCVDKTSSKNKFFVHVAKSGFQVFIRKPKYDYIEKRYNIKDINVELTTEALTHITDFDKIVIVSGKHDFLPLCEKMKELGKDVVIVGFNNNIHKGFKDYNIKYFEDFFNKK